MLVFKNGYGGEGVEIVADPEKFEDVREFFYVLRTYNESFTFDGKKFYIKLISY